MSAAPVIVPVRPTLQFAAAGLLVALTCWAGIELIPAGARVASIWLANGLLVGILLSVPTPRWPGFLIGGYLGNVLAGAVSGDLLAVTLSLALANTLEIVLAAGLLRLRLGAVIALEQPRALVHFALVAVLLAPLLSALVGAAVLSQGGGGPMLQLFAVWYPADALGMAIMVPLVLALTRPAAGELRRRPALELARTALPLLLGALIVFWLGRGPLLFLLFPLLMFMVIRLGSVGAVVGVGVLAVCAVTFTAQGYGPLAAADLAPQERDLLLQCFLATASGMALIHASQLECRRRYEQELARSERLLRSVTDNVPALIAHIDADQRYRFVNAHNRRIYGTEAGDMLGRSMREVRGDTLFAELRPQVEAALAGQAVCFESYRVVHGEGRYYQSSYVPDIAADGRVGGFYSLTFDVTERKQAELRLAQSEKRLRMITDHLPVLIAYVDRDLRYRFTNAYYRQVLGVDPASMIGKTMREVLGERIAAELSDYIATVLRGEPVRFERSGAPNRPELHFLVDYIPDIDEQGTVQGFYVSVMDISARKQAELRNAAEEDRLRTITDNLPVLIAQLDAGRVFRFCNRAHETWLGQPAASLIGRRIDQVLDPQVFEPQRFFLECALNGARADGSFEIDGPHGRRHLQVSYLPQLDAKGTVLGVYSLTTDVTQLKRVEQQLRQLARFDPLTGLANRREFNERLAGALARSRRSGNSIALLFVDVDHFKAINDSRGHTAGDEVLQEIALRIRHSVRQTDTVARFAGDEFVILLDQLLSADEPQFVARKIVAAVNQPFMLDLGKVNVSVSIGIARDLDRTASAEQLLQRADKALYAAKNAGRNTARLADS